MKATNLIQLARTKKPDRVLGFLKLAFNDFAYPVYLFGSYATGKFHGHSDVDIVIIAPDAEAKNVYCQACKQLAELGMNYDILIASSINTLNSSIVASLQAVSLTAPPYLASPPASMQPDIPVQPHRISAASSRHQRGLTLVELMIAMLLGLFLLGGILQIFISSRHTYTMQEGLSRLQENGRFAIDFMARDIRLAGFLGCYSQATFTNTLKPLTPPPSPTWNFLYDFSKAMEGFESTSATGWTPTMVNAITSPLGGSDVITIRRADEQGFSLAAPVNNPPLDFLILDQTVSTTNTSLTISNANLTVSTKNLKTAGFLDSNGNNNCAIAIVSDCTKAKVFQISAINTDTLKHDVNICTTPDNDPSNSNLSGYSTGAQVFPINTISYYVRSTPVKTDPATITPTDQISLYRRVGANPAQELVEGVERMKILYGVDTDAEGTPNHDTANYYVPAGAVAAADWAKVVSVRISLLVATIDEIASQPLAYTFNDEPHDGVVHGGVTFPLPTDRKLRRVFTTTIALRNRVP